ncbi:hypothetical protein KDK77_02010 [bacterium]|nr:hypothetical protein [bacterium]
MKTVLCACMFVVFAIGALNPVNAQTPVKSYLIVVGDEDSSGQNPVVSAGQAVVWNNRTSATPFQVVIDNYSLDITAHPLTRGFVRKGTFLVTRSLIVPGNAASYYFLQPGTYPYRVSGPGLSYNGTITVKE